MPVLSYSVFESSSSSSSSQSDKYYYIVSREAVDYVAVYDKNNQPKLVNWLQIQIDKYDKDI